MQSRLSRGLAAVTAMAIALALLVVSLTGPVISTTTDFSIFNSGWNGTSRLAVLTFQAGKFAPTFKVEATGTDISIVQLQLTDIDLDPVADALVVIGPTKDFTKSEGAAVGDFVRSGGMLLLADDFGTGNTLLSGMGAASRFSTYLAMDLAFEKQPEFSVCFDISRDQTTHNVTTILLNYPSSLTVNTSTTQTLARTSVASWLDTNGNRLEEPGEPRGPFPVLARERMGQGTILLLADPSVLINGMSEYLDNSVLAANLLNQVSADRSAVYYDESHRDFFDPISAASRMTGDIPTNVKVGLAILAFILTIWIATDLVERAFSWMIRLAGRYGGAVVSFVVPESWRRKRPEKRRPLTSEEIIDLSAEAHPEWTVGLVRYLLRERERHMRSRGAVSRNDEPDSP